MKSADPTLRYSRSGKQVTRDGQHFADAVDESAAELIITALNRRATLSPRYGTEYVRG
jgi:hypothetical protein